MCSHSRRFHEKQTLQGFGIACLNRNVPAAGGSSDSDKTTLPTLTGDKPLVIGHRGLPGLFPEEMQPSYEGAAAMVADSLELDLHLTKDCVLVARHNPWLSDNTNIAEVAKTNPTVAARKRTVPGRLVEVSWPSSVDAGPRTYLTDLVDPNDPKSVLKSLVVDGEDHIKDTGDWSITDFTVAELKEWNGFGGRPTIRKRTVLLRSMVNTPY